VEALPYLEQQPLYEQIAPDADGGARSFASNVVVPVYVCPSATPPTADVNDLESANYVGVSGAGTTREDWPLEEVICGISATDGVLPLRQEIALKEIVDGTSQTLAIGERSIFQLDEDWTLGAVWHRFGAAPRPDSACIASSKYVVWPINALESRRVYSVRDFTAPQGAPKALSNALPFGSAHPSGCYFAYADGSVHMLGEDADLNVLRALATRAGGEVEGAFAD
jgi:prepilin-type processing-associated H-X9-DG protein